MKGTVLGVEFPTRSLLWLKVSKTVGSAQKHGTIFRHLNLAHMRWNRVHTKTDAPITRHIRIRSVQHPAVVQGHLSRA